MSIDKSNVNQGQLFPLFDRIEIDFTSSGIEEELPVKQEANSSFEALYEDLYFNTLDYFVTLGNQMVNRPFKAPGGVIPYIHRQEDIYEPIYSFVKVYQWHEKECTDCITKQIVFDENGQFDSADIYVGTTHKVVTVKQQLKNKIIDAYQLTSKYKNFPEVKINYADLSYKGI